MNSAFSECKKCLFNSKDNISDFLLTQIQEFVIIVNITKKQQNGGVTQKR